jgi:hypothetical protein
MGGRGSGAKRSTNIANVEDMMALDLRALRRLGVARPGECIIDTLHWRIGGLSAASARLRIDLSDIERGGDMTITGMMPNGPVSQYIAIDTVPAPMGGHRCYYICPDTGERAEVLYYMDGRFASRKAHRLTYAVQGMDALSAARRKATKLRRHLAGKDCFPRPRGRNRVAMVERAEDAEYGARTLRRERLRRMVDASGAR